MPTTPTPDRSRITATTAGPAAPPAAGLSPALDGPLPTRVEILVAGHWTTTTAHAVRHGPRGPQALIGQSGRLFWIGLDRVRRPTQQRTGEQRPVTAPDAPTNPGSERP